ncbi:hypothetical protein TIFTF001_009906 [Ficus carica]|uniref:Uncharacterized protein n=1 Tax=Ficus carica TaxID=3494 RepID=A0AA87ZVI3_FICCA|nr:hypothetical protein TIFTF001_009906 [Ficus carica]
MSGDETIGFSLGTTKPIEAGVGNPAEMVYVCEVDVGVPLARFDVRKSLLTNTTSQDMRDGVLVIGAILALGHDNRAHLLGTSRTRELVFNY